MKKQEDLRYNYIQVLRFFAATAVVFFHSLSAGKTYLHTEKSLLFEVFRHGYLGVDLFFVISGFIISYTTHRTNQGAAAFFVRRCKRILPLYWGATFAMIFLAMVVPSAFKDPGWIEGNSITKSLLFITFADKRSPIVFQGWSLEFEMFFYLSVALILLRQEKVWNILAVVFSSLVILGCVLSLTNNYLAFFTSPLLLEFLFGVFVAGFICKSPLAIWAVLFVVCASCAVYIKDPSDNNIVIGGIAGALIVFLAAYLNRIKIAPTRLEMVLVVLGDASYSIYLVQVFTVPLVCKLWVRWVPSGAVDILIGVAVIVTVLAGYGVYVFIEKPMLRFTHKVLV